MSATRVEATGSNLEFGEPPCLNFKTTLTSSPATLVSVPAGRSWIQPASRSPMQQSDVRIDPRDPLPVKVQHQPQHAVGCRMLRTEVDCKTTIIKGLRIFCHRAPLPRAASAISICPGITDAPHGLAPCGRRRRAPRALEKGKP